MTSIIGDSMFAGGSSIPRHLSEWAGHSIPNYAIVGSSFHQGWVKSIPQQFQDIISSNQKPTTIIMDGGGNDVFSMLNQCEAFSLECQQMIQDMNQIWKELLARMGEHNVENVIFMSPYYVRQSLKRTIDFSVDLFSTECSQWEHPSCFFVDVRNLSFPLGWDGIHPTEEGYFQLANAIWDVKLDYSIPI